MSLTYGARDQEGEGDEEWKCVETHVDIKGRLQKARWNTACEAIGDYRKPRQTKEDCAASEEGRKESIETCG